MRKLALRVLIGSITLSALTGIYVLAFGAGGDVEGKVLTTALSISTLSILVMACGAAIERKKLWLVPHAGTVAGLGAFVLLMMVIWELGDRRLWAESALSLAVASAAAALACLLSLATLAPRFGWVRILGFASAAAVALLLTLFIWHLLDPENEAFGRLLGVLAILLGAVTITVPILHRMSEQPTRGARGAVRHCVACGAKLTGEANTELTCPECGARFRVEFRRAQRTDATVD